MVLRHERHVGRPQVAAPPPPYASGRPRYLARATLVAVFVATLGGACGTRESVPTRPPLPILDTVGVLAGDEAYADHRVFRLTSGRVWDRPNEAFRIAYDRAARSTLFVAGADSEGVFVLLIGGQEGLPAACEHAIGYGGHDWGDAIEAEGFLWRKSPTYAGPVLSIGTELPTTVRVCLDERAQATTIVDIRPSGDPEPSG